VTESTVGRLETIIDSFVSKMPKELSGCIVTNERGLVIAEMIRDGSHSHEFAAMISLLSDTATRINRNLGFSATESASIRSKDKTLCIHEFLVQNRRFRIGAIVRKNTGRKFRFLGRRSSMESIERALQNTAKEVRSILEHR
jgi:predicted regulator of Ras-like GTPase activity (Roadblock/LC7/MglB family)